MEGRVELLVRREGEEVRLLAPEVGLFTCALVRGSLVAAGMRAGRIVALGETVTLVVPPGISGRVVSKRPERIHHPVGYGDTLYALEPLGDVATEGVSSGDESADAELVLRAPYSGRFWHRPSPSADAFLAPGDAISPSTTVGLIEVMKTFTHLAYGAAPDLPRAAELVRYLVGDGEEVEEGEALLEVKARS